MADSENIPSDGPPLGGSAPGDKQNAKREGGGQAKAQGPVVDPFIREKQFPDAQAIFSFKASKLEEMLETAVFAFDANAILLPYKVNKAAFTELQKVLTKLSDQKQLLLPERAAREFAVHRLEKIAELYSSAYDWKESLRPIEARYSPALELIPQYAQYRTARAEADNQVRLCREFLEQVMSGLTSWYDSDPVLEFYKSVFVQDALVGCELSLDELIRDNERRNANHIPPGCAAEDTKKIDKGIGDKIIWNTLLEVARKRARDVVFVTQDVTKKDWVHYHTKSSRVLFPRFELAEEFRRSTNGKSLQIIELSTLLEVFKANQDAVESVQRAEQEERRSPEESVSPVLERIVGHLRGGPRSFHTLRVRGIPLTDEMFRDLATLHPNVLKTCLVASGPKSARKWMPGFHSVQKWPL